MNLSPDISVIVPVFNGEKTLSSCLDAIFRSTDINMEVIVVDDGSTDKSAEIAARYPVKLIKLPVNVGAGLARNPGATEAMASILLFTDADVELLPNTLQLIMETFDNNPNIDALFGAYTKECPHENFFSQYKNLHHHFIHHISKREAKTFWSGCGAIKKTAFEFVKGYIDQRFLHDIELGYRLIKAGYHIEIAPHIQVKHHKYYSFLSLVESDLFERAIPWTETMLKHRIYRNDMNTRKTDASSVALIAIAMLLLFSPAPALIKGFGFLGILGIISLLNMDWWKICLNFGGRGFAIKSMVMEWLYYLICGVGAVLGTIRYLVRKE